MIHGQHNRLSIDLQNAMFGDKNISSFDKIRKILLNDLKNFVVEQENDKLIEYNLQVFTSTWEIPLCDPSGRTGKKCIAGVAIRRHNQWPP